MEPQQTNSAPVSTPQVSKPNHKIFYILIFIFIALVGSAVCLFLQNPKKEVAQSVPVKNGVEEWKTYRNEEYGFEFKYPGDWELDTNKGDFSDDQLLFVMGSDQEYFNVYFDSCAQGTNDWQSGGLNEGGSFLNKKVCYKDITLELKVGGMSINKEKVVLEKILSTFKFIDKADTSTWKMYRNEEYGIEFKYPGDWVKIDNYQTDPDLITIVSSKEATERKCYEGCGPDLWFYVHKNTNVEKYIKDPGNLVYSPKKISIDNHIAYEVVEGGYDSYYVILVQKGNDLYEIFAYNNELNLSSDTVESQILRTFKFTK